MRAWGHVIMLALCVWVSCIWASPSSAETLPAVAPVATCDDMRWFKPDIPGFPTQITSTKIDKGACHIEGYISPQIKFEASLPLTGWTQRYLQTGCGGLCGSIHMDAPQRPCPALVRGEFVTASTDMGHQMKGGAWGASDQQVRIDFAYRGVHGTALVTKALIGKFYGQKPRFSYFSGCSDGGREALMEAQRYPEDFDGIAAGAPAMNFLVQNTIHHAWQARIMAPDGKTSLLHASDMPVLHAAVLAACDAADGVRDGLVSNPLGCRFDPRTIVCKPGQTAGCISTAAAAAVADVYRGAHDAQGNRLDVSGLMPGSEMGWPGVAVPHASRPTTDDQLRAPPRAAPGEEDLPGSKDFAADVIPFLAYERPLAATWALTDFNFDTQTLAGLEPMHAIYDATDPDLSRFAGHAGKLLLWHGLADEHISPGNTIAYAQAVTAQMGQAAADAMLKTFLIPGMAHCGNGDMSSIDVLSPLMVWVEDHTAPASIVASRSVADANAGKGRKVFAWPDSSALKAGLDPENPANWTRAAAFQPLAPLYSAWAGADFYKPGYERDCGFEGQQWECRPAL